jgi:hypothetical protein
VVLTLGRSGADALPWNRPSVFVAALGRSRASYVELVTDERVETLIAAHENAFRLGFPFKRSPDGSSSSIKDWFLAVIEDWSLVLLTPLGPEFTFDLIFWSEPVICDGWSMRNTRKIGHGIMTANGQTCIKLSHIAFIKACWPASMLARISKRARPR